MTALENGALEYAEQFINGISQKFSPFEVNAILAYILKKIKVSREEALTELTKEFDFREKVNIDFDNQVTSLFTKTN